MVFAYAIDDGIHGVLMHLFTRVSLSVKMNMFGYEVKNSTRTGASAPGLTSCV